VGEARELSNGREWLFGQGEQYRVVGIMKPLVWL
jgi:hypothetical protein